MGYWPHLVVASSPARSIGGRAAARVGGLGLTIVLGCAGGTQDSDDATATSTETTGDETMGATDFCHLGGTGESGGSATPWFELYHKGAPVTDGIVLGMECGFQGFFMLELIPWFGGFTPDDVFVDFAVQMDVDGYNLNAAGHFYSDDDLQFYIGCAIPEGNPPCLIPILPPDEIADVTALDGLSGSLRVIFRPDGVDQELEISAEVKIHAEADASWGACGYSP